MKILKLISLALVFTLIFSFVSCKEEGSVEETLGETLSDVLSDYSPETEIPAVSDTTSEVTTLNETTSQEETSEETTAIETTAATEIPATEENTTVSEIERTTSAEDDLSDTEKSLSVYKAAAEKTGTTVKSEQVIALSDISVNNGQLSGMFKYVTPMLSRFLSGSSTVTDGITGEFSLLTKEDIASSEMYETEKGTVVEFTLNPQKNRAADNSSDGSVAHGISVVADLGGIMGKLKDFGLPIEINLEKAELSYSNPRIRVLIGKDGTIINGTWEYTVEISLSDYTFAGAKVDSTRVVLENTITVNEGFNA